MSENTPGTQPERFRNDDEVDLFELLKTLWRWKWFVIGITLLGGAAALLYASMQPEKPVTYKAAAKVQVGKVLNVNIESPGDVTAYLQSDRFTSRLPSEDASVEVDVERIHDDSLIVTLSRTTPEAEPAEQTVRAAVETLVIRHRAIYEDAVAEYERFEPNPESFSEDFPGKLPLLWLDSYTYPTRVIRDTAVSAVPPPEDNAKMMVAVAAVASFFIAVLLAFFIDALRRRIREERSRQA
jgi:hypothetical protein